MDGEEVNFLIFKIKPMEQDCSIRWISANTSEPSSTVIMRISIESQIKENFTTGNSVNLKLLPQNLNI